MEEYCYITRRETFCAAHKLWNDNWTQEENEAAFGVCCNPNWHGHNFILFVTLKGKVNPDTGFVANLKDVGAIIKTKVIKQLDHKNLNLDVPWFKNTLASTENLAIAIWKQLAPEFISIGCELHCVKLQETENNYVEYFGGKLPSAN